MHDEIASSYRTCKDLQSLINITYNDVIKPLREASKSNPKSKIIALEIKDAEVNIKIFRIYLSYYFVRIKFLNIYLLK